MTRANIEIICGYPKSHTFERGSDGYPSNVMPDIFELIRASAHIEFGTKDKIAFWDRPNSWDLAEFIRECGLTLGHIGNFCYAYKIDYNNQMVEVWESTTYWINAPENWKERGWGCWEGSNGKFGYTNWKKGKKLISLKFSEMVKLVETTDGKIVPQIIVETLDKHIKD